MNNIILLTCKIKNQYFLYEKILDFFILLNKNYFTIKKIYVDKEDISKLFNEFPVIYLNGNIIESKNILKFIFELIFNDIDSCEYNNTFNFINDNYKLLNQKEIVNQIEKNYESHLIKINENHKKFFNLIFLISNFQFNNINEYKKILTINYNLNIINLKLEKFSLTNKKKIKENSFNNMTNENNLKNFIFSLSLFLGITGIMYFMSTIKF